MPPNVPPKSLRCSLCDAYLQSEDWTGDDFTGWTTVRLEPVGAGVFTWIFVCPSHGGVNLRWTSPSKDGPPGHSLGAKRPFP